MSDKVTERIFELAERLVTYSGGQLQVEKNECDDTAEQDKEADSFLKLNGVRLGRDLKLYAFLGEVAGVPMMLVHLLEELLIPTKSLQDSYCQGASLLQEWGAEVFEGEMAAEWPELF